MDSSQDDIFIPYNEPKCEELFDRLFDKNNELNQSTDEDDGEHLNVKKPTRTYQNVKRNKILRYGELHHDDVDEDQDDCSSDDEGVAHHFDDNHVPLFNGIDDDTDYDEEARTRYENRKIKRTNRRKKLAYPNVSKDAVLKAFQKAVESKELPDFDEIDKFPLQIVTENSTKKKSSKKKHRKSKKSIVESNQENINSLNNRTMSTNSRKNSLLPRSKKSQVLNEFDQNQLSEFNESNPNNYAKELIDLDESCIAATGTTTSVLTNISAISNPSKNDRKKSNSQKTIKSSTPHKPPQQQSRSLRSRTIKNYRI